MTNLIKDAFYRLFIDGRQTFHKDVDVMFFLSLDVFRNTYISVLILVLNAPYAQGVVRFYVSPRPKIRTTSSEPVNRRGVIALDLAVQCNILVDVGSHISFFRRLNGCINQLKLIVKSNLITIENKFQALNHNNLFKICLSKNMFIENISSQK